MRGAEALPTSPYWWCGAGAVALPTPGHAEGPTPEQGLQVRDEGRLGPGVAFGQGDRCLRGGAPRVRLLLHDHGSRPGDDEELAELVGLREFGDVLDRRVE